MKLLAALLVLAAQALGIHLNSPLIHPATVTLAPPSAKVLPVQPSAIPQPTGQEPLNLSATAAYAVDTATMTPLYASNANLHLPIASITKLMTAIVALHDLAPTQVITVGKLPAYDPEDATLGLTAGQKFKVSDLLQALLIESADDSADALAIADAGTVTRFEAKMNKAAGVFGLRQTHFASASGLTDENNYSSAHDLAILGSIVLSSPSLKAVVNTPRSTISELGGRHFSLSSTNSLLASGQFSGIKTGFTDAAGQCFVGVTTIAGHQVITVVLHSADRFGDTATLHDWIERNWQWPTLTPHKPLS